MTGQKGNCELLSLLRIQHWGDVQDSPAVSACTWVESHHLCTVISNIQSCVNTNKCKSKETKTNQKRRLF